MGSRMFSFVHFESPVPSAIYFVELVQDLGSCSLRAISQQPTDWYAPSTCTGVSYCAATDNRICRLAVVEIILLLLPECRQAAQAVTPAAVKRS